MNVPIFDLVRGWKPMNTLYEIMHDALTIHTQDYTFRRLKCQTP